MYLNSILYIRNIFSYCYHSLNRISYCLNQSDPTVVLQCFYLPYLGVCCFIFHFIQFILIHFIQKHILAFEEIWSKMKPRNLRSADCGSWPYSETRNKLKLRKDVKWNNFENYRWLVLLLTKFIAGMLVNYSCPKCHYG
jgi:hypothetical protein